VRESGLGQATAVEGLLGLGKALLQSGAATAILTLWKVDDRFTSHFVAHKLLSSIEVTHKSC
jgi:CHAT domain-containing protein